MAKIAHSIADLVGNTPIIQLNNINSNIYAKCEFMNPTSSVKDRVGMNMVIQAIKDGIVDKNSHIIEPTSGNTGVALASQCASLGIKLTLTMPESMSIERQKLMKIFGATLVLTPARKGMIGSINEAMRLEKEDDNAIILQQFKNPNNPFIHETTTSLEILKDMDSDIDIFIAAVGTGGSISGIGKVLKEHLPNVKIIAVEPTLKVIPDSSIVIVLLSFCNVHPFELNSNAESTILPFVPEVVLNIILSSSNTIFDAPLLCEICVKPLASS